MRRGFADGADRFRPRDGSRPAVAIPRSLRRTVDNHRRARTGTSVRCTRLAKSGSNRRLRRPRAQSKGCDRRDPEGLADGHNGSLRVGQIVTRVRHDLRRGPAPLRRVAVGVRAPVPRPDGQARRRLDRGPVAGDLDRSEDDLAQPAVDGRHGHRDLRLPAAAVVADRPSPLPHLRASDQRSVGRADHRPGDGAARRDAVHGAGADRPRAARASTASSSRSSGPRASGASRSTASCAGSTKRSRSTRSTSTTSRSSSIAW